MTEVCPICREQPATDDCPRHGRVCRRSHAALRLSTPCKQMSAAEAAAIWEQTKEDPPMTTKETSKDEGARAFSNILPQLEGGVHIELSEKTRELLVKLHAHAAHFGKAKGDVTLVLKFEVDNAGQVWVDPDVKVKEPKRSRPRSVFWLTEGKNLVAENPRQQKLPLREVSDKNGPAKEVAGERHEDAKSV